MKLIMVKTGNIKNDELLMVFILNFEKVISLIKENSLLEINKNEIIVHI